MKTHRSAVVRCAPGTASGRRRDEPGERGLHGLRRLSRRSPITVVSSAVAAVALVAGTALVALPAVGAAAAQVSHRPVPPRAAPTHIPARAPRPAAHTGVAPKPLGATPRLPRGAIHETFTVDSNGDASSGTSCASGHASGTCTLRAAVTAADADSGHVDAVDIPSGMHVTLSQEEPVDLTNSMEINGSGASVNGDSGEAFDMYDGPAVEITGLTITGALEDGYGGAVYCEDGALVLSGVKILHNTAAEGGGVYVERDAQLWVDDSTISGNVATGIQGGARPHAAGAPVDAYGEGGGIYVGGSAYITRSTIGGGSSSSANQAEYGAGLANEGTTTLVDSTVENNTSGPVFGYGVGVYNDGQIVIDRSTVDHNTSTVGANGDGVLNYDDAHISNSSVSDNSNVESSDSSGEAEGTGIYGDGVVLALRDVTLAGNHASSLDDGQIYGGAVLSYDHEFSFVGGSVTGTKNGTSGSNDYISGGVLYVDGYHATVNDVTVSGTTNNAHEEGIDGGDFDSYVEATFTDVTVSGTSNTADYVYGGVEYLEANLALDNVTMTSTTNTVTTSEGDDYVYGGAIYNDDSEMSIEGLTIDGTSNTTGPPASSPSASPTAYVYGGALYSEGDTTASGLSIADTSDLAQHGYGYVYGGVLYSSDSSMSLTESQFVGFTVKADRYVYGGAVYTDSSLAANGFTVGTGTVSVTAGSDDEPYGDGTILYAQGMTSVVNGTFDGVASTVSSGGDYLYAFEFSGEDPALFTNTTIANDSIAGPSGKAWLIWAEGEDISMRDSIVASDSPSLNCGVAESNFVSSGYDIDNGSSCGFTNVGDHQNTNPEVLPLADNGGPILTAALQPAVGSTKASPAIDAGSNVGCAPTDARGVVRPQGKACDIGAYEDPAQGYWLTNSVGAVTHKGAGSSYGSLEPGTPLGGPIIALLPTPAHNGYWLVGSDGGVFTFGRAAFYGSLGGENLTSPITGSAVTPDGKGYWLVSARGEVFTFGDATNYGMIHAATFTTDVEAIMPTKDGKGYWLATTGGKVIPFGDAKGAASTVHAGVVSMAPTLDGQGYWLATSGGSVIPFGDAKTYGFAAHPASPVVAIVPTPDCFGYWLVEANGTVLNFGDAKALGSASSAASSGGSANY